MNENNLKKLVKDSYELIDNWLDYQTYINELPGLAAGIFIDDEIIFQKEYGYANLESKTKLNKEHLFRVASHSKLFTATAIMKLYYEEKLSLDDKVSKYLPWFTSEQDENLQHISIHHLLTHSSGITANGKINYYDSEKTAALEMIKKQIKNGISYFKTNETVKYSNFGYILLGLIIEAVSGKKYEEYIQNEILHPLAMNNSYPEYNDSNSSKHAAGYSMKLPRKEREIFSQYPIDLLNPAAGISSNVEDLIKFYQGHMYGNDTLLPDDIKREMQRIQFRMNNENRGYGFALSQNPEAGIIYHRGGHPGFRTMSGLKQDDKMIVVILTNSTNNSVENLFWGILTMIHYLQLNMGTLLNKPEKEIPDLKDIVNFYEEVYGPRLFSQINSHLILLDPGSTNPTGSMQILQHKEGHTFTVNRNGPNISIGEDIRFEKQSNGDFIYLDCQRGEHRKFDFDY